MNKTYVAKLVASAAALAILISGCTSTDKNAAVGEDATIAIGSLYEPQNLDNISGGGQGGVETLGGNVYQGLFSLQDDGEVSPQLAKDFTISEDGLVYTFHLREGVTFHSGANFTSKEVKKSIERVTAKDSQSARKSQLGVIKKITTPDDVTLVIELSQRSISLPYNLSMVWIFGPGTDNYKTETDGTGPYTFGEWKRGNSISLDRWDGYWGAPAKNKEVVFNYFTDAAALSNALIADQIDVVTNIQSPDALAQFGGNIDYTITNGKSTTKQILAFNNRVAPFNKVEVRQAIYSAIDTKKLLKSMWGEYGTLIGAMSAPSDPWYEDLTSNHPYDVELAKAKLAEAGLADGFSFTLDTPNYDPHPTVAEFVKTELAKIGITVKINIISSDEWYSKVFKEKNFEVTLQEHVNDRDLVWYGNPEFYWGYQNDQVTNWISQAEQAASVDEQTHLMREVNRQVSKDAASVWLYLYPQIIVSSSVVTGYPVNGLNAQFFAFNIAKK